MTEAGSEEGPALLLHAAYLGTRIGSDGGEGDNVGVRGPFALSSRPLQLFSVLSVWLAFFLCLVCLHARVYMCADDYNSTVPAPLGRLYSQRSR